MTATSSPLPLGAASTGSTAASASTGIPASTARSGWTVPRVAGAALGVVYISVGVLGAVLTGWSHLASMDGTTLLVFQVNPLHNVAHLGLGAALLVGALVGAETARSVDRLVGVVFLLLSLVGPFLMRAAMSPVQMNGWDHVLHIGTAALLLGAVYLSRDRSPRRGA